MLKLLRKIFGCYSEPIIQDLNLTSHEYPISKPSESPSEKLEKDILLTNTIDAVLQNKREILIDHVEQAYTDTYNSVKNL